MHTYDVYLRRRLTEIDVIITQLVQRDAFTIYNWLTLFATLDDIEVRKALDVKSEMIIDTRLENFLEYVYEQINSEMYLIAATDLLSLALTEGETEMVLFADEFNILEKSFTGGNSILEISGSLSDYYIAHSFGEAEFDIGMFMSDLDTFKYSFEKMDSQLSLLTDINFAGQKILDVDEFAMYLDAVPFDIFYLLTTGGKSATDLYAKPLTNYILKKVLHDLDTQTILDVYVDQIWELTKAISLENVVNAFVEMIETIIQYIQPTGNKTVISCECSAGLKRYRLLEEMDDLTLSDFDNMTLNEVDYVILAE